MYVTLSISSNAFKLFMKQSQKIIYNDDEVVKMYCTVYKEDIGE